MGFSNTLRHLIDEQPLTQKELALAFNIAPSTLSSYAVGAREPDYSTLVTLADYFCVTTDYLLDHTDTRLEAFPEEEREILRIFRSLSPAERSLFLEQGKSIARFSSKKDGLRLNNAASS